MDLEDEYLGTACKCCHGPAEVSLPPAGSTARATCSSAAQRTCHQTCGTRRMACASAPSMGTTEQSGRATSHVSYNFSVRFICKSSTYYAACNSWLCVAS